MTVPTPTATGAAVGIEELTISYRRRGELRRVITDVSLDIAPGEAYGLVGESGCGKTTVAMALMRYLPPNAVVEHGSIRVGDADMLTLGDGALRRLRGDRMAMVYQHPGSALNPSMRIGAQVAELYRFHRRMSKPDALEAAHAMLAKVQISDAEHVARRYAHELSGGQQQRVMIAMALATDPDLLVLDEPTTGLDATVEAEVLELVAQLRREFGASVLFISHNLGIVSRLCDRVGVLYAGRIVEEGHTRRLFAEPRHPYTLALLRCVPRLGMRKDARRLDPIPGALPAPGERVDGCVYADRCPIAQDRCRVEEPALLSLGDGRSARCHFSEQVPDIPPLERSDSHTATATATVDGELLTVEGVSKAYRSGRHAVTAVDGVQLVVGRGEVLGLVGESGSGKTSLAKLIAGLVEPTTGTIAFDGRPLSRSRRRQERQLRRSLQMVLQNPDSALNPRHSVRRILTRSVKRLAASPDRSAREQRVRELSHEVKLSPAHLAVLPGALSGGLKQRVAIARALAGEPSLVICDEPVSALDVSVQAAILNLLVDLQARQGLSYLFISHDLAVVSYLADRIAVMYLGQIVEIGPAEEVFAPPHHPYTEALLSASPSFDLGAPRKRIRLQGAIPSPSDPPSGCRFHTRCPRFLGDQCVKQEPPWQRDGERGHVYRCHIPPDELRDSLGI